MTDWGLPTVGLNVKKYVSIRKLRELYLFRIHISHLLTTVKFVGILLSEIVLNWMGNMRWTTLQSCQPSHYHSRHQFCENLYVYALVSHSKVGWIYLTWNRVAPKGKGMQRVVTKLPSLPTPRKTLYTWASCIVQTAGHIFFSGFQVYILVKG